MVNLRTDDLLEQDYQEAGKLPPDTSLGFVHLTISELERSVSFYRDSLGFKVHKVESDTAYLGAGGKDMLVLTEIPGARRAPRTSGLYHFAILTPSRFALANSLNHLIETETTIQGGADHLVSEAIYLADPDGNGIEIYRDRPRDQWVFEDGSLKMATDPLDYQGILRELGNSHHEWKGMAPETRLGHVHMHVADLNQATAFYERVLGFDFLINYVGTASFLSAGGYHHHIGLNTWNGVGAPPPPPDSVGLRYFTVLVPGENHLAELKERLTQAGSQFEETDEGILTNDPSQNGILFTLA